MIEILDAGVLTTVQDRGRPGHASIGVSPSGAVDPMLADRCNRLVGNDEGTAVIETVGGLRFRAVTAVVIASDTEPSARVLRADEQLELPVGQRQWHYVALRGGVLADSALGSRSTDTLGHLGPSVLRAGDRIGVGPEPVEPVSGEVAPIVEPTRRVRLTLGPRAEWFDDRALDVLVGASWTAAAASRVGVRLTGPVLERVELGELPSEGLVRGAIQVPPDGQPVMMVSDHPTTGGYPVIAVVEPADVRIVAQLLSGTTVRFVL